MFQVLRNVDSQLVPTMGVIDCHHTIVYILWQSDE
jgi:hypothetical protein